MRKRFNITGSCNPQQHYMVDNAKRFDAVQMLIEHGDYFTINRARQYGKTTMLQTIRRRLSDRYLILKTSFEGVGDEEFKGQEAFVRMFARMMLDEIPEDADLDYGRKIWGNDGLDSFNMLGKSVTAFCRQSARPVLLLIDEVDKNSDNRTFLSFLGLLRDMYLRREDKGMNSTFHSVILASVYDIKNLKRKLRPDAERKYNSPWNIAADFKVDMTFQPEEIAQMIGEYERDVHTGMNIKAISEEIYKYTTGYPYLVSAICKLIDEDYGKEWNRGSVQRAVKHLVRGDNTLMDDLSKNLENNEDLREFLFSISVNSTSYAFALVDPMVKLASMFSYIREENGVVRIHNIIFEEAMHFYFTLACLRKDMPKLVPYQSNYVINGQLNMEYVVTRFRELMHEEYRDSTVPFLEREGRLLFLTFLKPIINGTGFYYVEPQTRDNRRMDLVVTYGRQEFIIELKIWRGEKYEQRGRDQLAAYLATRGMTEGYLVTFDFSKTPHDPGPQWVEQHGRRIFEVVV